MTARKTAADFAPFGWQGITARVPADWTLGAIGGDYKAGYLRLDDERMARLEVKWSEQNVDLDRALDKYLARLRKQGRGNLAVQEHARVVSRRAKRDKQLRGFAWRDREHAAGVIWKCRTCKRTVVAQVLSSADERGDELAQEVLRSLEDHAREGRHTWALYGLEFRAPQEFRLERQKLMAGYLELAFAVGRRRLRVRRWGMAEVVLRERDLQHWFEVEEVRRRDVVWECEPAQVNGHDGLEVTGHRRRLLHGTRRALEAISRLQIASDFNGQVWHCPHHNRIYGVEAMHHQEPALVAEVASSVPCHA